MRTHSDSLAEREGREYSHHQHGYDGALTYFSAMINQWNATASRLLPLQAVELPAMGTLTNFGLIQVISTCRPHDSHPSGSLYTAVMPVKNPPVKLVGIAAFLLLGGMTIASFQGCHGTKQSEPTSERRGVRTPLIQGRAATKADYDSGVAIYYVPGGRSAPYSLGRDLPIRAEVVKPGVGNWVIGHQVSIVQAETTDGQNVTLGVIDGDEQAVCSLADVKLLK